MDGAAFAVTSIVVRQLHRHSKTPCGGVEPSRVKPAAVKLERGSQVCVPRRTDQGNTPASWSPSSVAPFQVALRLGYSRIRCCVALRSRRKQKPTTHPRAASLSNHEPNQSNGTAQHDEASRVTLWALQKKRKWKRGAVRVANEEGSQDTKIAPLHA